MWATRKFRHYLLGTTFTLEIYHKPLEWLELATQAEPCPLTASTTMVIGTTCFQLQCGLSSWKQQPVCRFIIPIACASLGRPLVQAAAATRCPGTRSHLISSKMTTTTGPYLSTYLLQLEEVSLTPLQAIVASAYSNRPYSLQSDEVPDHDRI